MKIKSILVTQPKPENKSPYFSLAEQHGIKVDFRPFVEVRGVTAKEFRRNQKDIDFTKYTAVIMTSKLAIDHFFRITNELRIPVPDSTKYFCKNAAIANYLQKYTTYRKRKIFYGEGGRMDSLYEELRKHKSENFLLPLAKEHKVDVLKKLKRMKLKFTKAVLYETLHADLQDLANVNYDILVFFTPVGIRSLLSNFPDFKQNSTKIATFGDSTAKAVREAGLRTDIKAPRKDIPSMTKALEVFIRDNNG